MKWHLKTSAAIVVALASGTVVRTETCSLSPLGAGKDDTAQVLAAIATCGKGGTTVFSPGDYNITKRMNWELNSATVHMDGAYLHFQPNISYWLDAANTYRVVFIQNQASWFVVTGSDFVLDAHGTGGIRGVGQAWWTYFATRTREDGGGRPIALTLSHVARAVVKGFRVEAPPFWCNTVADSHDVRYEGMYCNATNTDPDYAGMNIVPNTDGINTYRSDNITLFDWDVTCGDDCLAIKGNSTNIYAQGITCRGGNGIAIGSLGQYANLSDIVDNLTIKDVKLERLSTAVQPNLQNGVYFKTWTGTSTGSPPTGGGGGGGYVSNVLVQNVTLDRAKTPVHVYQTNGGHSGDAPSQLQFSNLSFVDWSGVANTDLLVDIECSSAAPCPNVRFDEFSVVPPSGSVGRYICKNVVGAELGLPCSSTGQST